MSDTTTVPVAAIPAVIAALSELATEMDERPITAQDVRHQIARLRRQAAEDGTFQMRRR